MRHVSALVVVLAAGWLGGCGGGGDDAAGTPAGATAPRASTPPVTTPRATPGPTTGAASAPTRNACALIPRRAISQAFGAAAPAGRKAGSGAVTNCEFAGGADGLKVVVTPAAPGARRALERGPIAAPQRRVRLPGAVAVARTLIKPGPAGSQAVISFVKGTTMIELVLTDRAMRRGSLTATVVELARVAARRA